MNASDMSDADRKERNSMAREICSHRGENPGAVNRSGQEGWEKYEPLAGTVIREAERLFALRIPTNAQGVKVRDALKAAEQELIDLSRSASIVFNRSTKQYEFSDAHIERALPGTFAVIKKIRAALALSSTEGK